MSSSVDRPEIGADEARMANDAIPGFNNKISRVYRIAARGTAGLAAARDPLTFGEDVDRGRDVPVCRAPAAGK